MRLHVHRWGTGPRAVLVHGAVLGGEPTHLTGLFCGAIERFWRAADPG